MAHNFTASLSYEGKTLLAVVIPSLKRNGVHYEVNVTGYPRFWVHWGVMDRYELVQPADAKLPDALVLAISDIIESTQPAR